MNDRECTRTGYYRARSEGKRVIITYICQKGIEIAKKLDEITAILDRESE